MPHAARHSLGAGRFAVRAARQHDRHLHERGGGAGSRRGERRRRATPTPPHDHLRSSLPSPRPPQRPSAAPPPSPSARTAGPRPPRGRPRGLPAAAFAALRGRAGGARPRRRAARGTPGARARSDQAPPGARASVARPQATRGSRPAARGAGAPRNPAQLPTLRKAWRGERGPRPHRRLAHHHRPRAPRRLHRGGRWGFDRASWHLAGFGLKVSSSAPAG